MSNLKESKHLKIPLKEIERGTKNFEDCIGKGGYGNVYKGELVISGKPTVVAVKRLNIQYGQGLKEFLTEIQLLSGQKHPNLISLLGYCDEGMEKLIVYEYVERGSLDRYLRRNDTTYTLMWWERLKICVDAARGLNYLHNHVGKHQAIIHRDIKSANILIDKNWVGKVSDLGLSKLSLAGLNRSEVVSQACGTPGYCEPEYFITNIVKKESDIYSFVAKDFYEKKKLDEIVDPSLKGEISLDSMNKFAEIAYRCLHNDRGKRPPMGLVVQELEESLKFQSFLRESSKKSPSLTSKTYLKRKSESSNSKSCSKKEQRLEKVKRIFTHFDLNKDGGLDREELEALLVARDSNYINYSREKIDTELDKVFHLYDKFINGEKGLTFNGLLHIYDDDDSDLDYDFDALGLETKTNYPNEPNLSTWERSEKAWIIFQQFDLNDDGGLNREELAAFFVATNPSVQYGEEEINTSLDNFFDLYKNYIDGVKGLTLNGLLLSYDRGDRDLDYDIQTLQELKPKPCINHCINQPNKSFLEVVQTCLIAFLAVLVLDYLLGGNLFVERNEFSFYGCTSCFDEE